MPRLDGIEATRRVVERGETPKVLVLTTFDLDEYVYAALRRARAGSCSRTPAAELLSAIRAVHTGDAVVAPGPTRRLLDRFRRCSRARRPSGPDRLDVLTDARARGARGGRQGTEQRRDRREPLPRRGDGEDPRRTDPRQAGTARPGAAVVLAYELGIVRVGGA